MKKKNLVKVLAALLGVLMIVSLFSGCGKSGSDANQKIIYNLGPEPDTIDPAFNEAVDGGNVINAVFEGLTRLDENSRVKPGVAESWDVSDDQLVYTFHLRKDAKWSDGQPVTAKDFEYAWKRVLNPETAAPYVSQLLYIKNAQAYFEGKANVEDLGIEVVDDYTLKVTLEAPTPYFLELCAFATLMPVRKDIVEANKDTWATKPETYIGNGPFVLKTWSHNDAMEFEKNKNYWDEKNVKLTSMTWVMVVEASSALVSYEKGEIDFFEAPPASDMERLKNSGDLQTFPYIGTYYIMFNNKKAPFNNPKVRRALTLAFSRQPIIDAALKGGQKPATAFVPYGIYDADGSTEFRVKGGDFFPAEGNIEEAKKLLAEAGYPDGKGFPEVTYLYNTSEAHKKVAEAIQDMWKKNLGINVKLANQEWKVFQNTRKAGDYDIARGGWIGDYMDPMTFIDLFLSKSDLNDPKYNNPVYDDYVAKAKKEANKETRMQYLHEAEKTLMTDMPIAPIYFYTNNVCIKPYVKGVIKTPMGNVYFDRVYIDESLKK